MTGPPPPPAAPVSAALMGPVGALEIIGRGIDLNVAAASDVRRVAIFIGLLALAAAGPVVAVLLVASGLSDELPMIGGQIDFAEIQARNAVRGLAQLTVLVGAGSLIALAIDSQLLTVHVIASRATSRPFSIRPALEIVRLRFWRLARANVLVAAILFIPRAILESVIAPGGIGSQSQTIAQVVLDLALTIPFAYIATGILLGQVGAREAVRRSWRMVRHRPSLAIVITALTVGFQTVALVALGSAADILVRIATFLGLDHAEGIGLVPLGAFFATAIVATGSLVVTIGALTIGPQVVAFLRLTGADGGLVALHDPDNPFATPRREHLVSRPMLAALVVEVLLAAVTLSQLR